jgi:tetratricopeptide (TPR) repeat protein
MPGGMTLWGPDHRRTPTLLNATALCVFVLAGCGLIALDARAQSGPSSPEKEFVEGQQALRDHHWAEAIEAFRRAIRLRPGWSAAYGLLATADAELGKLDEAGESFKKAIQLDPSQASFHAGLASVYAHQMRFAEAVPEFEHAVQLDPKNVDSRYNLALTYMAEKSYRRAVGELTQASRLDPTSPEIRINLAVTELLAGDGAAGAAVADSIERQWESSPKVLYTLGQALAQQQAWNLAAKALEPARNQMPRESAISILWAKCQIELHNFHEAETTLLPLREGEGDSADSEVLFGTTEFELGKLDLAMEAFRQAEALDARNPEAHYGVGELLFQKPDIPGAVAELQEACNLAPKDLRFVMGLGQALLKSRQNTQAAQFLQARLDAFHDVPEISYMLGLAQYNQRHYSDAVASFQTTLALDPKEHRASFMLGNAWAQLGDFKKSNVAYRNALRLSPNSALYYISSASLLEREGELREAAENLRKAILLEPDIPFSHYALGRIMVELGEYQEAISELTKSLDLDSSMARPYYLLAVCYERTGNQASAEKYRTKFASMAAQSQREEFLNLGGDLEALPFASSQFSRGPTAH